MLLLLIIASHRSVKALLARAIFLSVESWKLLSEIVQRVGIASHA